MTKQRFGLGWLSLGLLVGVLGIAFGACTRVESDDDSGDDGGSRNSSNNNNNTDNQQNGGGGNTVYTNNTGSGLVGNQTTVATSRGGTTAKTTVATTNVAKGGTTTKTTNSGTGNVQACEGIPAAAVDEAAAAAACNGASIEAEPLPCDMIILMDRSISNSYAIGSESATPAGGGELTRWDVLTAAMEALATSEEAKNLGASLTFFSYTGGSNSADECTAADYAKPIVPLALLSTVDANGVSQGQKLVDAMKTVSPRGLTPTVPALTGVFQYAMAEKKKDSTREKVVVMISDGYPTICDLRSPSDVANVIEEAAGAAVPIKSFIIGIGSPGTMDGAKFNLQNYARSGNTGKPPYVLDEAAGADAVRSQLITTLLNISKATLACEYEVKPPTPDWVIDPEAVSFTWKPSAGDLQEIPRVSGPTACSKSPNGGWYFDDTLAPKKISVCPCTCANFGAGRGTVLYGCKPNLIIE